MKTNFLTWLFLGAIACSSCIAQKIQYTKRAKNEIREGPGNYFPLKGVLRNGARVEPRKTDGGWIDVGVKTDSGQLEGWMAKMCLQISSQKNGIGDISIPVTSLQASPAAVAAAVRGFALRYGKTTPGELDLLEQLAEHMFTPAEYAAFKKANPAVPKEIDARTVKGNVTYASADYQFGETEQGIGLGIAARVAGNSLVAESKLFNYVNMLMTYLGENGGAYDHPFKVFVLNEKRLNAIALPGGYIFITQPMLHTCENEAELAAVLAHEMMHVVLRHGLKEMGQRKTDLQADSAMQEMEEELAPDTAEADLEDFAADAFDLTHKPRLIEYEEEADQGAAVLLARSGYEPTSLLDMIKKIEKAVSTGEYASEDNPFAGVDFAKRYKSAKHFIEDKLEDVKGAKNKPRFDSYVK